MKRAVQALIVFTTLAVFSAAITGGHISMDDWGYIYGCPFVKDGLSIGNVVSSFTEMGYDAFWMPFTFMTYMADITLFGGGWEIHHAVNVTIHLVNSALVFALLKKFSDAFARDASEGAKILSCAAAALFWALHPMRAEAVTYIASRKDLLWSFFAFVTIAAWMDHLATRSRVKAALAFLSCFFACLSKPTAMSIVFLVFSLDWALSGRFPRRLARYAPMLAMSVVLGAITLYSQSNPIDHERLDVFGESFAWRSLNAAVSLGMYAWHVVCPLSIRFDYRAVFGGWPVDGWFGLASLAVFSCAAAGVFVRCRSLRATLLLSLSWIVFSLGPVLGVFGTVNGDHAYADRYTYFPAFAISLFIAVALARQSSRPRRLRAAALSLIVFTALATPLSVSVIRSYRDDYSAFSRTLGKDPDHWRALRVVGSHYCARDGKMDEGVGMLRKSLSSRPSQRTAETLSYVLSLRGAEGDFAEVRSLCAAVAKNPRLDRSGFMLESLGIVSLAEGDDKEALRCFSAALEVPCRAHRDSHARLFLGYALANSGERARAVRLLENLRDTTGGDVRFKAAAAVRLLKSGVKKRFTPQRDLPFSTPDERGKLSKNEKTER